jgi:hypothetical protein
MATGEQEDAPIERVAEHLFQRLNA